LPNQIVVRPRLAPTPRADPPFDVSEPNLRRIARPAPQPVLPLGFGVRCGASVVSAAPRCPVGASPRRPAAARSGTERARDAEEHGVQRWCTTFAQAVVEVLAGVRPAAQLLTWTTRPVHGLLERRATLALAARAAPRQVPAPRRPATAARLGNVHVRRPSAGAVEANLVVHDRGRSRALAFRLEERGGRWICTALELG
jgi:uncharacterized protein DUF6459